MTKPQKRYHGPQKNTPYKLGESPNFGAPSRGEAVCRPFQGDSCAEGTTCAVDAVLPGQGSYAEGTRKREAANIGFTFGNYSNLT